MTNKNDLKTFDDLSEQYATWIIKYCSTSFDKPLFLVWYTNTDEDSTSRLLTYKNGQIFAGETLENLKEHILSSLDELVEFENLNAWLDNFSDIAVKAYCTYDLIAIDNEIAKHNLDIETIEGFANFVNLFDDFVHQNPKNANFKVHIDHKLVKKMWKYFYNFIFWPRFNDSEKFEAWDRPPLVIDKKKLLTVLKDLIQTFDDNVEVVKNSL
jgi:hypothetical protein